MIGFDNLFVLLSYLFICLSFALLSKSRMDAQSSRVPIGLSVHAVMLFWFFFDFQNFRDRSGDPADL